MNRWAIIECPYGTKIKSKQLHINLMKKVEIETANAFYAPFTEN
jgi:hypothetical protein